MFSQEYSAYQSYLLINIFSNDIYHQCMWILCWNVLLKTDFQEKWIIHEQKVNFFKFL